MTTRSQNTVTITQPISKVQQAYTNQEYWDFITKHLSPEPGQVHEFSESNGGAVATLFEVLPQSLLPEAFQAMISQSLKVKRVVTVGALNGESASHSYTADVKGTPVDFEGTIEARSEGESTVLEYANSVTVNIPMMGAAIEPKVGDALAELFAQEGELTNQWINEHLS